MAFVLLCLFLWFLALISRSKANVCRLTPGWIKEPILVTRVEAKQAFSLYPELKGRRPRLDATPSVFCQAVIRLSNLPLKQDISRDWVADRIGTPKWSTPLVTILLPTQEPYLPTASLARNQ